MKPDHIGDAAGMVKGGQGRSSKSVESEASSAVLMFLVLLLTFLFILVCEP